MSFECLHWDVILSYLDQQLCLKCLIFLHARISVPESSQILAHHTFSRTEKSAQIEYHRIWKQWKSLLCAELSSKGKCTYWTYFLIIKLFFLFAALFFWNSDVLHVTVLKLHAVWLSVLNPHFGNGSRIRTWWALNGSFKI